MRGKRTREKNTTVLPKNMIKERVNAIIDDNSVDAGAELDIKELQTYITLVSKNIFLYLI